MPETPPDATRSYAFCYLGLLQCGGQLEQILKILPPEKQQLMAVYLERAKSLPPEELAGRLRSLRQQLARPKGLAKTPWGSLSPALQRCLSAATQENDGTEDHQSRDRA